MGWLQLVILTLKLLSVCSTWATESKLKDEGAADALARVLAQATKIIDNARKARASVDDAIAHGGLRDDDGHARD